MSKISVSEDLLKNLTCITCQNILSIFPVYVIKKGNGAICGRCTPLENYIEDKAYENIAEFILFPCINKNNGCSIKLTPSELKEHERECEYIHFPCVSKNTNCQWKGARCKLYEHFEQTHPELIINEHKFDIEFTAHFDVTMLMKDQSEIFVVERVLDEELNKFKCSVKHMESNNNDGVLHCYTFNINLSTGTLIHRVPEKSCGGNGNGIGDKDNWVELDVAEIKDELNAPDVVTVDIVIKKIIRQGNSTSKIEDVTLNPNINWKLLLELECPVCYDHMMAPIFQCVVGHSICQSCKEKVKECPTCKGRLENTRNFNLEKMTQRLNYPCKYYKQGCTFYALCADIKKHESDCEFGFLSCPMNRSGCKWNGTTLDILSHVAENHANNIIKTESIEWTFNQHANSRQIKLISYAKKIFALEYKYGNNNFYWSVQLVSSKGECKDFQYEIDVIDLSGRGMRSFWRQNVVSLQKDDTFQKSENYVSFTYEQLEKLVTDKVKFRIKILKV